MKQLDLFKMDIVPVIDHKSAPVTRSVPVTREVEITGYVVTPEVELYLHHINRIYDHVIEVEPMPTPRPRTRVVQNSYKKAFATIYHPTEYTSYKGSITFLIKKLVADGKLKAGDYSALFATFYMPYPKSTPKKYLIEGSKHRKKPDWDNFIKGFQDGLSDAGILLSGDGGIADGAVRKRYTTQPEGRIEFTLAL